MLKSWLSNRLEQVLLRFLFEGDGGPLDAARGCINGFILSMVLWVIILAIGGGLWLWVMGR